MRTRKLFVFLVLCLTVALCAVTGFATEETTPESTDAITWTVENNVLTISGTGAMDNYTYSQRPDWYSYRSSVTSIVIEEGVTVIGDYAFQSFSAATKVTIPKSVTSMGTYAFYNCSNLSDLYITDLAAWCSIEFKYYDSNPTYYAENFYLNEELVTELVIPKGVTSIAANAFYKCYNFISVSIPSGVTFIGKSAFANCSGLKTVTCDSIADWCKISFENESANPTFYAYGLTVDGQAVTDLVIPEGTTAIENYAFYYCTGLTSVTISEGVETVGSHTFYGCTGITSVSLPTTLQESKSYAFYNCSGITAVHIKDLHKWYTTSFSDSYANPTYYAKSLTLNDEPVTTVSIQPGTVAIGKYVFANCADITAVYIPEDLQTIGNGAFYGCSNISTVSVSSINAWCNIDFENYSSTPVYYAKALLVNGQSLTTLTIPEDVTVIDDYAFYNCANLTTLYMHSGITEVGSSAFSGCSALTYVSTTDLNAWCRIQFKGSYANPLSYAKTLRLNGQIVNTVAFPDDITSVSAYAFCSCTSLTSVFIPEGVTSIGTSAFSNCSNLTSVSIPDSVTSIGSNAFNSCTNLSSVSLPNGLTELGTYAFQYCHKLSSVDFPAGLSTIPSYAFKNCIGLTQLSFPANIKTIDTYAFDSCSGITDLYFSRYAPTINSNAFRSVTATAHYPYDSTGWTSSNKISYGGSLTWQMYSISGTIAEGTCGDGVIWFLDSSGTLVITGDGSMNDYSISYSKTTAPWSSHVKSVKKLFVDKYVDYIGKYAFFGCNNLTQIQFIGYCPDFANYAFYGVNATAIYEGSDWTWYPSELSGFGGNITWKPKGMSETYLAHGNLTSTWFTWHLDYDGNFYLYADYSSFPDYGSTNTPWFGYRNHIKKVVLEGNFSKIGNHAFSGCPELVSVDIRSTQLNAIGDYAFDSCLKLTDISLPDNVYGIGKYAFAFCESLESIYLPGDQYNSSIGEYAFAYCYGLKEISIPGDATLGNYVFYGDSALKTIYFSDNTSLYNFSATSTSFSSITANVLYPRGCSLYYSAKQNYGGTLTWIESDYGMCGPHARWSYDPDAKLLTVSGTGWICGSYFAGHDFPWGAFQDDILYINVENGITYIPSYTFEYCENVTSVTLPSTLKIIYLNAFNDCGSLNNLLLPASIESFDSYYNNFIRCESLTDVYFFGTQEEWNAIPNASTVGSHNSKMTIHFLVDGSIPATCTEPGTQSHYRFDKTDVYDSLYDLNKNVITSVGVTPALGHDIGDWQTDLAPTCTEAGTEKKVCSRCDYSESREAAALGHSFTSYVSDENATCLEDGTKTAKCDRCDATDTQTDVDSKLGHSFTNYISDENATCLEDGTKTAKCDRCDVTHTQTDSNSKLGHSFTTYISNDNATCTENGTKTAKCDRCEATDTQTDADTKLGHSFTNYVSNNDATYDSDGTKTAKCDRCEVTDTVTDEGSKLIRNGWFQIDGKWYYYRDDAPISGWLQTGGNWYYFDSSGAMVTGVVTIDGTHHKFSETGAWISSDHSFVNYISDGNATCETDGTKTAQCDYDGCTATDTVTDEGSRLGHSFSDYISDGNATCETDGTKTAKCDRCDATNTQTDADSKLGHSFTNYISNNDATCTEDGYKTAKCDRCDATDMQRDDGSALGHDMGAWVVTEQPGCTYTGGETSYCSRCSYFVWKSLEPTGHSFTDTVTVPSCTSVGYTTHACSCGYSYVDSYTEALDHSFTDYKSNNDATCLEDGTETAKCDRCDATNTQTDTGTKLGHDMGTWETTNAPTCTETGTQRSDCSRCDHFETRDVTATGHSYGSLVVVGPGESKQECHCGDTLTQYQTGWSFWQNKWYFRNADHTLATGWFQNGSLWYYMDHNGIMQTGWLQQGSTWYYLKPNGSMVTGWYKISNTYYYFVSSGAMLTGWLQSGSLWYYLNTSGAMVTGWQQIDGTWYYFKPAGDMATGWLQLGSTWYYFHSSGAMATGTVYIGGIAYHFNSSGAWLG